MAGKSLLRGFAAEVRRTRTHLGLSQEELADRANLHRNYIGMIERAERTPTLLAIEGIAKGLQLKASELIARAEDRVLAAAPLPRESAPYSRGKAQAHRPHRS